VTILLTRLAPLLLPQVSFFTVFNGVTITMFCYIVFCMATYYFGARTRIALDDSGLRRRFKTQCLNTFIWGVFLVYPQVASTTLLIFACTKLEDDTDWLMADYRIQCYTPKHKLYIGVGAFWTLLLPLGIPATIVYVLWRSQVPALARWKRDCAWLRSIAQRALILGVQTELLFDPDTVTLESISMEHLKLLHRLFVHSTDGIVDEDALKEASVQPSRRSLTSDLPPEAQAITERSLADTLRGQLSLLRVASVKGAAEEHARAEAADADAAANAAAAHVPSRRGSLDGGDAEAEAEAAGGIVTHHAPNVGRASAEVPPGGIDGADGAGTDVRTSAAATTSPGRQRIAGTAGSGPGRRASMRRSASTVVDPAMLPKNRLLATFVKVRVQVAIIAAMKHKELRKTFSTLFYSNERELLLLQLLEWAKHDKSTLVAEPRDNQLRWRTQYEWDALRSEGAKLGARDTAERAAFFKYRFLFADYAVHAWFWEAIDMVQKLFLTSIISFIAPRTAVQVIVACLFAFGMVLFTIQVKPYRERSNNQLVSLSQVNLFLFLFTGLLLQSNPDGIAENRLLFAVVVGALTTSIVVFTFFLFLRELWRQLVAVLLDMQDEEEEDNMSAYGSDDEEDAEGGAAGGGGGYGGGAVVTRGHYGTGGSSDEDDHPLGMMGGGAGQQRTVWDEAGGDGAGHENGNGNGDAEAPGGEHAPAEEAAPEAAATATAGTPPPPSWVARLASREGSAKLGVT
jgi:hypothetical protein